MLDALHNRNPDWELDKNAENSKDYSLTELFTALGISPSSDNIRKSVLETLTGLGDLETTARPQSVNRLIGGKTIVGYSINISKLKNFEQPA
jgi:hypothetical protein